MELVIDPNTSILARFDDVDIFKGLLNLVQNVVGPSSDLFLVFDPQGVRFHVRSIDINTKYYIDLVTRLKSYRLGHYQYQSKGVIYIIRLNIKILLNTLKNYNSKHKDHIYLSRMGHEQKIRISKNKNYYDSIPEKDFMDDFEDFKSFSYQTCPFKPVAVVELSYLSNITKELLKYDQDTMLVYVCSDGIALVGLNDTEKRQIRILGNLSDDYSTKYLWKGIISTKNLAKLSKIDGLYSFGMARIYLELDKKGKPLPMKIGCSVGDMGKVDLYLEMGLYEK